MCLIVERLDPKFQLTDADLNDYFGNNPDGWGLVLTDGSTKVFRGMTLDALKKALKVVGSKPYYLHFRMATHGRVDKSMTHPFDVFGDGRLMLIHNGIVGCTPADKTKSDTWELARLLSTMLDHKDYSRTVRSEGFRFLMEAYLGSSNRLVLVDKHGGVTFNDQLWHTMGDGHLAGMRVSNTYAWSYRTKKTGGGHPSSETKSTFQGWLNKSYGIDTESVDHGYDEGRYTSRDVHLNDPFYVGEDPSYAPKGYDWDDEYLDPSVMSFRDLKEACWDDPDWAAAELQAVYGNK